MYAVNQCSNPRNTAIKQIKCCIWIRLPRLKFFVHPQNEQNSACPDKNTRSQTKKALYINICATVIRSNTSSCKAYTIYLPEILTNKNGPPSVAINKEVFTKTVRSNTKKIHRDDNWNLLLYKEAYHIKRSAPPLNNEFKKASRELCLLSWQFLLGFVFCIFTFHLNFSFLYVTLVWRWYRIISNMTRKPTSACICSLLHRHNAFTRSLFYSISFEIISG